MKKTLPIILSCILLFLFIFDSYISFHTTNDTTSKPDIRIVQTAKAASPPTPTPIPQPILYTPKQLSIPKIGLTANIVPVGLDNNGRMDVPNNFVDVGWYDLGYKPGEQGSAVLDGHSDDFHGNPAVFYHLDELQPGDQILVTDQMNKVYTYVVSDNEVYPVDQLPLQQIFTTHDQARLNLITCHGTWDDGAQTYNQRTVIYATLQQ